MHLHSPAYTLREIGSAERDDYLTAMTERLAKLRALSDKSTKAKPRKGRPKRWKEDASKSN